MPHTTLLSTDTLASHLDDALWLVVDCRYNLKDEEWGRPQYVAAHIPGAVFVHLARDLAGPKTGANGRHPLPSPDVMAGTFGRLGIDTGTQVVVYDHDAGQYASRLWWMLRYMGHDAVALLDGGWTKWVREGRPVRAGEERRPPVAFLPRLRQDMRVTVDEVESHLGHAGVVLVDARSPERFEGQPDPLDNVPGHIPGARNHCYRNNLSEDGTMRPADALRADFTSLLGDRSADQFVMYCGSGVTACHNLLAMEHAGLPGAKLFAGSWSEWEADPRRPIEKS